MILGKAFEGFVDGSPVCVMIRGSQEYALSEEFVDEIFETTAEKQYSRDLLFSDVVDVMASVVCQVFPSVNAAYTKQQDRFSVSRRALYDKIAKVEPGVSRELVRQDRLHLGGTIDMARTRFFPRDSSERFGGVAPRIGSREVLTELPNHAQVVLLVPAT